MFFSYDLIFILQSFPGKKRNSTSPQQNRSLPITSVFILISRSILPLWGTKTSRSSKLSRRAHCQFNHTRKYTRNTSHAKKTHVFVNSSRRRGYTSKNTTDVRSDSGWCFEGKACTEHALWMGVGIPRADRTRSESIHFCCKGLQGRLREDEDKMTPRMAPHLATNVMLDSKAVFNLILVAVIACFISLCFVCSCDTQNRILRCMVSQF